MFSLAAKRHLASLSMLLLLLISLSGGDRGRILCISPDGRVALEHVSSGCCDDAETLSWQSVILPPVEDAEGHHCDSCVDIPLSAMEHCIRSMQHAHLNFSPAKNIEANVFCTSLAAERCVPNPVHYGMQRLASIRSVTLRI